MAPSWRRYLTFRSAARRAGLLALALLGASGGCVGTPTPEPPDFLPIDGSLVTPESIVVVSSPPSLLPVSILGEPGAVRGGTDVWLVNLDNLSVAAVTVRSRADGSFRAEIEGNAGGSLVPLAGGSAGFRVTDGGAPLGAIDAASVLSIVDRDRQRRR